MNVQIIQFKDADVEKVSGYYASPNHRVTDLVQLY
jgi:hypothetical protein